MNNVDLTVKVSSGVLRDYEFLRFCYEQKFMLKKQIDTWFGFNSEFGSNESKKRVARRAVLRLLNLGLLNESTDRFFGKSKIYEVTKSGIQSLADKGVLPEYCSKAQKNGATIYHDSLVTNIRLICQHLGVFENWISDRFLKFDDKEITPDASVTLKAKKLTLAIEVELTQKSKTRLRDIFYKYKTSHYDMVLYFVENQRLLNSLKKLAAEYTAKIFFCTIDDFFNLQLNSVWVNQTDSFKTEKLTNGANNG